MSILNRSAYALIIRCCELLSEHNYYSCVVHKYSLLIQAFILVSGANTSKYW